MAQYRYIGYEQVDATGTVRSAADDLTIPAQCTHAEFQADTGDIRYTMDGTNPQQGSGMVFATTHAPKLFTREQFVLLKWRRGSATDAKLNVHYLGLVTV